GKEGQGRPGRLHAQADRHPQHHAGAGPELEPARGRRRPRVSKRAPARSAPAVDRMTANQPGEPTGSRPQPSKAGAPSARLEPGRAPGYPSTSQLLTPTLSAPRAERESRSRPGSGSERNYRG